MPNCKLYWLQLKRLSNGENNKCSKKIWFYDQSLNTIDSTSKLTQKNDETSIKVTDKTPYRMIIELFVMYPICARTNTIYRDYIKGGNTKLIICNIISYLLRYKI